MENENENVQVEQEIAEQEETTREEVEETPQEDVVTISKDKFKSMQRKAIAYDATKKNKPLQTKEEPDKEIYKSVKRLEEIESKRQFGFENQLSPEETDFVFKITGGKPDKTILENPFVKSGLEGYRSKKRIESNTPSSSSSYSPFKGKSFKEMSDDERKSAYEEAGKKFVR